MSQLAKLVELLDREDVTEVVIATGRPVAVRSEGEYRPISRNPVSRGQLATLVADSPLAALVGAGQAQEIVELHGRRLGVEVQPLGAELMLRLTRAPRGKRPTTRAPRGAAAAAAAAPVAAKPPTQSGARMKSPTQSGARVKPATHSAARVKAPTQSGARAKSPTQSGARVKSPTQSGARVARPARAAGGGVAALANAARARHATDLHLAPGLPAMARLLGSVMPIGEPLDAAVVDDLLLPLLDGAQRAQLEERGYVDCAIDVEGGRLRANFSRVRGGHKGSFRLIAPTPPTLEALGLPKELARITTYHQGLVVIAGPNGHGKTTTLAALVDLINSSKAHHILTIEDPVEVIHPRKRALISQREVGTHTRSFVTALKASLREDPDVIVIGELRDRETVEIALTAAETGHLVMATMSTPSAAKTLDRLIDMFPPDDQQQVRMSLAAALKFVVAQRLLPTADGEGVVVAVELLTGVLPLAALIRDNKLFQVGSLQQRGRAFGMIRLDDSLAELVRAGRITEEVAIRAAENKRELANFLRPQAAPVAAPAGTGAAANLKSRLGGLFGGDKRGGG